MKQLNALQIRVNEPLDDQFQVRPPSVLAECLRMLVTNGIQSPDQIQRAIGLNLADVESLCGVQDGFLNTSVVQFQPRSKI